MAALSPSTPSADPLVLALKEWLRATQAHELLPAPAGLRSDSAVTGLALQLKQVSNFDLRAMRCHLTLCHKASGTFFGRTFVSRSNATEPVALLSQTRDEAVVVVCELVNLRMVQDTVDGASAVAWTYLDLFSSPGQRQAQLFAGSCRGIVSGQQPAATQMVLDYEVWAFQELLTVASVIPLNALVGLAEQVPGVMRGQIPQPGSQPQLEQGMAASLKAVTVVGGVALDEKVLNFANEWRRNMFNVADSVKSVVQERKVYVGQHNSWQCVGGSLEASGVLRPTAEGNLECSSLLTLQRYLASPACALVFEVEYSVTVPRAAQQGSEFLKLLVGWVPYPSANAASGPASVRLLLGPGTSVTGRLLMNPNGELPMQLSFLLSTSGASYQPQPYAAPLSATAPSAALSIDEQAIRRQVALEKDREIQTLRLELEEQRKRALESSQVVPVQLPPPKFTSTMEVQTSLLEAAPPLKRATMFADAQIETMQPQAFEPPTRPEYLQSLAPVPLVTPSQTQSFVSMPALMPRDISRADRAHLVRSGVRGLLEGFEGPGLMNPPRLDVEAEDPLSAAIMLIQFLSYRPPPQGTSLPTRLHFSLRFFTFPNFVTDTVRFSKGQEGSPWVLVRDGPDPDLVLKFEVEPSPQDKLEFAKYLAKKQVSITVWDADSLMNVGLARVPLAEAMRQGKPQTTVTKEYPVIDEFTGQSLGALQLLVRHIGKAPMIVERLQPSQNPYKLASGTQSIVQKRKIRSQAITFTATDSQSLPLTGEDQRKRARVMEWKKSAAPDSDWSKQEQLRQATIIREARKPEVIKAKLREYYSAGFTLYAKPGVATVLQYSLQNPLNHEECFNIVIEDPRKELSVVTAPAEWQYWVSHRDLDRPAEWDMVSKDLSVILKPYETVPLVFKFYSMSPEEGTVKAWIHQSTGTSVSALEFQVKSQACSVDHVFRFFEEEKSSRRLVLPPLYSTRQPETPPILVCSLPKAMVQWENAQQISIQLRVPEAPALLRFNIMAYADPYFGDLQALWEVEVHSLVGVVVKTMQGQVSSVKLVCPGDEPRTVALYASDPLVTFPPPHNAPFTLLPKTSNNLGLMARNDSSLTKRVRVHLVDVHHKVLVHAWSLELQSSAAAVAQVYQVQCSAGTPSDKKVTYVNRTSAWALFNFRSSHPDLLQIRDPRLALDPGAQGFLSIHFAPRTEPGVAEICVFASDSDEGVFETLLFKVEYL